MKREELEGLSWQVGTDGESFWVEPMETETTTSTDGPAATLQAAAPALALACLEAYDLIYSEPVGSEREMALDALQEKLIAALAAAGVRSPMATDHFSKLWAKSFDEPSDHDNDERKILALHFYEAGRVYAQTEIRQALIAEAARIWELPAAEVYQGPAQAQDLRTFAAGLIGLKGGE